MVTCDMRADPGALLCECADVVGYACVDDVELVAASKSQDHLYATNPTPPPHPPKKKPKAPHFPFWGGGPGWLQVVSTLGSNLHGFAFLQKTCF